MRLALSIERNSVVSLTLDRTSWANEVIRYSTWYHNHVIRKTTYLSTYLGTGHDVTQRLTGARPETLWSPRITPNLHRVCSSTSNKSIHPAGLLFP